MPSRKPTIKHSRDQCFSRAHTNERCETYCVLCKPEKQTHRFKYAWQLRRHIKLVHIPREKPDPTDDKKENIKKIATRYKPNRITKKVKKSSKKGDISSLAGYSDEFLNEMVAAGAIGEEERHVDTNPPPSPTTTALPEFGALENSANIAWYIDEL